MTKYKVSLEYYTENAVKANEWLIDNAPDYVLKCVEGVTERFMHSALQAVQTEIDKVSKNRYD